LVFQSTDIGNLSSEVPKASALPALPTLTDRRELGTRSLGVHDLNPQRFLTDGKLLTFCNLLGILL